MTPDQQSSVYNFNDLTDIEFTEVAKKRFNEAEGHWNRTGKDNTNRRLSEVRSDNRKLYLSSFIEEQLIDDRYEEVFNDNRQFVAVQTIVPFVTGQITAAEVTPANKDQLSKLFAKDFETVMQMHAERINSKYKVRLSVRDVVIGMRVGVGKWRYDAELDDIVYEHIDPESIIIGKRANLFEEPDVRQILKRTPGDLVKQFPDKQQMITDLFGLSKVNTAQWDEKEYEIKEDWVWLRDKKGTKILVTGWSYQNTCFGKIRNPNWKDGGQNMLPYEMVPYVFYNLINDGSSYIDQTSFAEQAKYSQRQYNKRGQTIAESARYGGTGVPIFAKGSITQKDAAKVHFSPVQRVLLDTDDVNKSFTTWQQANLPNFIVEDKQELRAAVDDTYGTNSISRGQPSDQKTATQDVLLRNQAEGRQADLLDMIEVGMHRFYMLEAQMAYMYWTDTKYFNYIGDDGEFVSIAVSQKDIAKNLGLQIGVKAGTSLPIDRAQKRATLLELAKMQRIGTLTLFQELGLFDDPEDAYKQWLKEQPALAPIAGTILEQVDNDLFDRDALQDLVDAIGGKKPKERDDIGPEYVNFLNEWLLTDKFKLLTPVQQSRVSDFVDGIIAKAQRKADKLALQPQPGAGMPAPPMPPGMPPQPGQPQAPPQGPPGNLPPELAAPGAASPTGMASAMPSAAGVVQ